MAEIAQRPRRSAGDALVPLTALACLATIAAMGMIAFDVGIAVGTMSAATAYIVYCVPAVVFDWPRLTFDHVVAVFGTLAGWIWSAICSLWE